MTLAVGVIYLYQDKIIQLFVAEGNKHIKTKIAVEKMEVSLWEKFPQVAISLHNVEVTEAVEGSTAPLAKLERVHSTFSLWDIVKGTYRIREIYLEEGELMVKVLPNGQVNYLFFQNADTVQTGKMRYDLQHIGLKKVKVIYQDAPGKQHYELQAHLLSAALAVDDPVITIQTEGTALVHSVRVAGHEFIRQKEIQLNSQLAINTATKQITLEPSDLQIEKALYQFGGQIAYKDKTYIDLAVQGKNTNVQSLLALIPQKYTKQLAQYQSQGDVYFKGKVKGEVSANKSPFFDVAFGCKRASFYHPDYKEKVEGVTLEGRFTNGAQRNSQTSMLELRNVRGNLRGKPFSGEFAYQNFSDPYIQAQLKADVDVAHVLGAFPVEEISKGSGQAQVQFSFAGNLNTFKTNPGSSKIKTSGDIQLRNVSLLFRQHPQYLNGLTGTFLFRKNDVAVTNFKGKVGDSDFLLNGYFKNVLPWVFLKGQKLRIEADFESAFLNLDQLLAAANSADGAAPKSNKKPSTDYAFNMPANLELDLNAAVRHLQFRRFKAKQLQGQVRLQNQVITTPNIALQAVGGKFRVRGTMDARHPLIKITSTANIDHIKVDSLMYAFENFGQAFITQRHLNGELTAQIDSDLFFDHQLNARTDLMQAEIKTSIQNGQLLYFEPLQKLSAFVDRRELANLRFSELKNNFFIQSRTIYIPEMEIQTSASRFSSITVSGTHTFDQDMDYRLRIPLAITTAKRDKDERFGVIETSSAPNPMLFLTIKGKEGNFKVAYDQEKVKDKIASDLQREKQELKDVLKGKKKEEKSVKPATEFFEFE
ncbi:AsmA family protein [Rufibacter roseus]|uniref:AsmA-like C-terminal region-containing protein n=1 Tax=Rufibacter roseus TaxID=1567108 RepID=A0ABW2DK36_9BACT|nr:AsmA-like C-terminal region-containing protein [Rufibacter roseus]